MWSSNNQCWYIGIYSQINFHLQIGIQSSRLPNSLKLWVVESLFCGWWMIIETPFYKHQVLKNQWETRGRKNYSFFRIAQQFYLRREDDWRMIWAAYKCTGSLPGQITASKHSSLPASNHLLASLTMSRVQFLHMAPTCRFKRSAVMIRFWLIFRVCKF